MGASYEGTAAKTEQSSPSTPEHSETNIQVQGVDEADIVKNDGRYIYAVSGKDLFIIKSYPARESEVISKIKFDSNPKNIYLNGDRLAIFGRNNQIYEKEKFSDLKKREDFTFFKIFDISDKENPEQVRSLNFEGQYFDSRMIGDYVYFVTSNPRYHYIEGAPPAPRILEDGRSLTQDCQGKKCISPELYYFDIPYDNYNFTNIASINIKDAEEQINSEMYLFSGNQDMYVSRNNIYITYTKRVDSQTLTMEITLNTLEPELPEEEKKKIKKIKQTEDYILTEEEKWEKIGKVIEKYFHELPEDKQEKKEEELEKKIKDKWADIRKELEKTVIHKLAIEEDEPKYQTRGEVTGHVLNQFSMSEKDGYFRIATTKGEDWGGPMSSNQNQSYSNVYVLNKQMEVVGGVEELAPGERIYSARFMQDRAYLVTFKQMDPLFVIDLKDPEKPEVLGKLKIPGFSNYLHPYDKDTLIGIGKDTEAEKWGVQEKGLKIALFDASDVENPKQVDTQILGEMGSDSFALDDHKAFLFDKERNLISMPVKLRGATTTTTTTQETVTREEREMIAPPSRPMPRPDYFRGAAVLHVDENEINLRDIIKHGKGKNRSNQVKRSLYIEDNLYTLSDNYLKINELEDLEEIKELKLEMQNEDDYQVIN